MSLPFFDYEGRVAGLIGLVSESQIAALADFLLRLDADSSKPITLYLAARGGDMVDGLVLADTISLLRSKVTAVGMGLLEGAAVLALTLAEQRILFQSCMVSTAGLWDTPRIHESVRRIGLHPIQGETDLTGVLESRVRQLLTQSGGRIPSLLVNSKAAPRVLGADEALAAGLADAVIRGPDRSLIKPRIPSHANARLSL